MMMALVVAKEVINRYKKGHRLSPREKMLCLMVIVQALHATERISYESIQLETCKRDMIQAQHNHDTIHGDMD